MALTRFALKAASALTPTPCLGRPASPLRPGDAQVTRADFVRALTKCPSRLTADVLAFYDRYRASSAVPSL